MNARTASMLVLFFFLPAAFSTPGKIYYALAGMSESANVSGFHALLLPSILLAAALLVLRSREKRAPARASASGVCIGLALLLWFIAATLSTVANAKTDMVPLFYVAGFISAMSVYWALHYMPLSRRDLELIFVALSVGSLFPLLLGLQAYYKEFGMPDFQALLRARYDFARFLPYQQATFGNNGNTAAFLLLVGPAFLVLALDESHGKVLRLWFSACSMLVGVHILLVQSRAAFLVLFLLIPVVLYFRRPSKLVLAVIAIASVLIILQAPTVDSDAWAQFSERLTAAATVDANRDASVAGREAAMREGWDTFLENWEAGVGPGGSLIHNTYTSAHQFNIHQALELGVLGLIASVLLVLGVMWRATEIIQSGSRRAGSCDRFVFIIGPACYLLYGIIGDTPLSNGVVNTWITLAAAFLALVDFRAISITSVSSREELLPTAGAEQAARLAYSLTNHSASL